jgi:DNA topoisomerase I
MATEFVAADTPLSTHDLAAAHEAATEAGLRYVSDTTPGIRREEHGKSFRYLDPKGQVITDEKSLDRIRSLGIPPAWKDVWICPRPNGHIQATGRDAKGRKQYRYHPHWREVRDESKYHRMIAFGEALPQMRAQVRHDLTLHGLPRARVLATVVELLDETAIRVGNEEYARTNQSFGLTTLHNKHVRVSSDEIRLTFRGKSGKQHAIALHDRRLARIVKQLRDLPGQELFQYVGDDGATHAVTSDEVNAYLREISGQDFTAKDFRTWVGTVTAATYLVACQPTTTDREAKHQVIEAIKVAADKLGNTPAICRKSYVHPHLLSTYLAGKLWDHMPKPVEEAAQTLADDHHEALVLALLHSLEEGQQTQP